MSIEFKVVEHPIICGSHRLEAEKRIRSQLK